MLLAQVGEGALVLDVGLLQIAAELGKLGLALLVELDLGRGSTASLLQTLAQLFELAGEVGALLFGLGARLALGLDLFLELLDAGLELLDLLLELADDGLLVLQLGGQGGDLLVLALDGLLELLLVALQVGDGLLGQLEVALNLPLGLLDITTARNNVMVRLPTLEIDARSTRKSKNACEKLLQLLLTAASSRAQGSPQARPGSVRA